MFASMSFPVISRLFFIIIFTVTGVITENVRNILKTSLCQLYTALLSLLSIRVTSFGISVIFIFIFLLWATWRKALRINSEKKLNSIIAFLMTPLCFKRTLLLSSSSCLIICMRPTSKHTARQGQFGSTYPSLPSYLNQKKHFI